MSTLRALSTRAHAALILPCLAVLSACGGSAEPVQNNVSEPDNVQENAVNAAAVPVTNEASNQAAATPAPAAEATEAAATKPAAETAAPKETAAATPAPAKVATSAPASAPAAAPEGDAANGAKLFAQCRVCHSVEPDKNGLGPSLHGVVGRKAGTLAGFNYSPAVKGSGITWSASALNTYLRSPMKAMPGTKMAFAGIADDAKRADVIAYLQTLK
ncbi:cytochrome c2 [Sphingobium sp. B11D3B]|uniref:c-type cytochrome n=1 Tax=Sphingobium sp. B11D3B TaxID=2940575 RepID=UPI0022271C1A|nr:cytochrome c family protein [Sphingobium sp. B11D3B]MCW2389868.1 cytochrome c2 [Sphingobium sp. B11D3B]